MDFPWSKAFKVTKWLVSEFGKEGLMERREALHKYNNETLKIDETCKRVEPGY